MKKLMIIMIAMVGMTISVMGANERFRDSKSMAKFIKSLPDSIINNKISVDARSPFYIKDDYFKPMPDSILRAYRFMGIKKVSLMDVDRQRLNQVEQNLIDNYFDVCVVNKYFNGYLIVDESFRMGYANYQGKVIIEPCEGGMISLSIKGNIIGAGNVLDMKQNSVYTGFGSFTCVLNLDTEQFIIEPGRFDYISAFIFGITKDSQYQNYLVGKRQENGEVLFGLLDQNGVEIEPCKYMGIVCNDILSHTFKYSTTETSQELYQKEQIRKQVQQKMKEEEEARQQALEESRAKLIQDIAMGVVNTLNAVQAVVDVAMPESTTSGYTSSSTSSGTSSKSGSIKEFTNPQGYQEAKNAYRSWEDLVIKMKTGVMTYNEADLKYYQRNMQNIRTRWQSKGYDFHQSDLETWHL